MTIRQILYAPLWDVRLMAYPFSQIMGVMLA